MNETNEHNPDGLTPEQYGAPEWRLLSLNDELIDGDEGDASYNGTDWLPHRSPKGTVVAQVNICAYRRRVSLSESKGGDEPCAQPKKHPDHGPAHSLSNAPVVVRSLDQGQPEGSIENHFNYAETFAKSDLVVSLHVAREQVGAQSARIAELERRVEELTEKEKRRLKLESERLFPNHTRNVERALLNAEEQLSQLRAEVERQLAEREEDRWQPIETAPKDGTEFQGWMSCSARWVPQMRWSVGHERWEHRTHDRWILLYPQLVTHWQPLPKPPAIRAARAQPEDVK